MEEEKIPKKSKLLQDIYKNLFVGVATTGVAELSKAPLLKIVKTQAQNNPQNLNFFKFSQALIQEKGKSFLWTETGLLLRRSFPTPFSFTFYNILQTRLGNLTKFTNFEYTSGALAGILTSLISYPFIVDGNSHKNGNGLFKYYKGLSYFLPSTIVYRTFYYGTYRHLKRKLNLNEKPSLLKNIGLATSVSLVASLISTPFHRIFISSHVEEKSYKDFALQMIEKKEFGYKKAFKGKVPYIIIFFSGIQLVIFDGIIKNIN